MRKTLLALLMTGAMALFSPTSDAQTYYPSLDAKINPFKQPNSAKPIVWDTISTRAQRENLLKQDLVVDKTDTITYKDPSFISGDFARQLNMNFYGMSGFVFSPSDTTTLTKYDTTKIGKFNLPLFWVNRSSSNGSHGMNAILVGDNPKNFNDWSFVEPQTDSVNVKPGTWNIPSNSIVDIQQTYWYINQNNQNRSIKETVVKFNIVNSVPSLASYDTARLVLDRTTDVVERLEDVATDFSLSQNYPNPFNPETKIKYSLEKEAMVSLKVYDVLGREVQTLVDGVLQSGEHIVDFNASKLSSGVYFYRLKAGDFVETKKMVVNK